MTIARPQELPSAEQQHKESFGHRSEDQIIGKQPDVFTIGGETIEIKPLPILKANQWREKFAEFANELVIPCLALLHVFSQMQGAEEHEFGEQDGATAAAAMGQILTAPARLFDLTATYCGWSDADKERLGNVMTDAELIAIFGRICAQAMLPFVSPFKQIAGLSFKS